MPIIFLEDTRYLKTSAQVTSPLNISILFQAHPWFRSIQWDMLYEMEAAYKPTVTGDLDTQNFEKFPEVSTKMFMYWKC